ncbi:deoxyribodipyrimidine photo-lyase [Pararoseomonas indoligenes]|uniref:Deoxyribodipyrimidine photo-lyase n=1 Tax=Roseomonas indoligenes TaxID=2820811 RepID=A0A940S8I6_9PROT|nr:deoxyribodipyrimidine photo-lyase [Pararoseomonas indoligenes]MBP0495955.1 deoxyribodipyrimidine photo-lyase [Pararoseomonas indoligenes]
MIQTSRIETIKDAPENPAGRYVLYWMGLSQRARFNPALEHAVDLANERGLPVLVCYGIAEDIPETTARHWAFLLEGLAEVGPALQKRGIGFVARRSPPVETALEFAGDAALVVCDRSEMRPVLAIQAQFTARAPCRVVRVEGDVVVPVGTASPKHEIGARTLRPRIGRLLPEYLVPMEERRVRRKIEAVPESTLDLSDIPRLVGQLRTDQSVRPVRRFRGGTAEAERRLKAYLSGPFGDYGTNRGRPEAGAASHMSPYLHFGQISPVAIGLAVRESPVGEAEDRQSYLEELVVRRELAMNHLRYEPRYDSYEAAPAWARKTLDAHRTDPRPFLYTREQFEQGLTHDRYWNAAMKEMRETGYMHNHMRMYWGKKILEWSASPEEAFETTLRMNNRFFIDGRDANSFTNVTWLFGLHDRPWGPRPVYGNVRSMGAATLKKFDADAYLRTVDELAAAEAG